MPGAEEDFDSYFDTLSKMKDDETPPANFGEPVDPNAPVVDPAAPVVDPVVVDPAAPVVDPVDEPVVEPVVVPPVAADNTELLSRLADLLDKRAPAPAAPKAPVAPQPIYTESEAAVLTQFEQDYPDVAAAFALYRKGDTIQNNAKLYNEIGQVLGPQIATIQTVAGSHQLSELRRMIPDYDKVRDPVIAWAKDAKQPDYLRTAYESVINAGDAHQITDMVNRWRQETGAPAAPTSGQVVPPKTAAASERSPAVIQAAAALAPVTSKRTPVAASEPTSFDDAFKAYADLKD